MNLQGVERAGHRARRRAGARRARSCPRCSLDGTLELLADAPRPLKTRDRVRFHAGTQRGDGARAAAWTAPSSSPGESCLRALPARGAARRAARRPLRDPLLLADRHHRRRHRSSTSRRPASSGRARRSPQHLALLATGAPAAGAGGAPPPGRRGGRAGRRPPGADALRAGAAPRAARGAPAGRARSWRWTGSGICTGTRAIACAPRRSPCSRHFHRENPLRGGISREELRSRAGHAQERVFAQLLGALEAEGVVRSERDQVRLASHAIRLSPEQQRVVDGLEADFRERAARRPRARRRRWPATGSRAPRSTSSSRCWSRTGRWCGSRSRSSSTPTPCGTIQDQLVALLAPEEGDRPRRLQGPLRGQPEVRHPADGVLRRPARHGPGRRAPGPPRGVRAR